MVKLDKCNGSCHTLDDPFGIIYVPNKTDDVYLNVLNMITEISESKTLTKHISCRFECKFDGRNCDLNQKRNNNRCRCDAKI